MGIIKTTLDLNVLTDILHNAETIQNTAEDPVKNDRGSIQNLNSYVFENIFLPIIRDECIPVARIDFGMITRDNIVQLEDMLNNCNALAMFEIGAAFSEMRPAVSKTSTFI